MIATDTTAPAGSGETLWCVHVIGPNDIHAAPNVRTAAEWAHMLNSFAAERMNPPTISADDYVMCFANVVEWPGSAASHAADLPRSIARMTPRRPPNADTRFKQAFDALVRAAEREGNREIIVGPARVLVDGYATPAWTMTLRREDAALTRSASASEGAVPAGWTLAPLIETTAMLKAGANAWLADPCRRSSTLYRAMLAAAPRPPQPETPSPVGGEDRGLRAFARQDCAVRLQMRLDAMDERGLENLGIGKSFARDLLYALKEPGHLCETPASPPAAVGGVDREVVRTDEPSTEELRSAVRERLILINQHPWPTTSDEFHQFFITARMKAGAALDMFALIEERFLATAATPPAADQEAVARIIDPETWARLDRYAADHVKLGDTPYQARATADSDYAFYTAPSLATAGAILARVRGAAFPKAEQVEAVEDGWLPIETLPPSGELEIWLIFQPGLGVDLA